MKYFILLCVFLSGCSNIDNYQDYETFKKKCEEKNLRFAESRSFGGYMWCESTGGVRFYQEDFE